MNSTRSAVNVPADAVNFALGGVDMLIYSLAYSLADFHHPYRSGLDRYCGWISANVLGPGVALLSINAHAVFST